MGYPAVVEGGEQPVCTDNFQIAPFELDGKRWHSVEQCFQALKFGDEGLVERIRSLEPAQGDDAVSFGMKTIQAGRARDPSFRADWELVKQEVMYRAVRAKFACNVDNRAELLATGRKRIQHPEEGFWGEWNTNIILRVREELRPPGERDQALLGELVHRFEQQREAGGTSGHVGSLPSLVELPLPGEVVPVKVQEPAPGKATTMSSLRGAAAELVAALRTSPLAKLRIGKQPELQRASLLDLGRPALAQRLAQLVSTQRRWWDNCIGEQQKGRELDRALGAMVGMAVADSLGHNFEFLPARDHPRENYMEYPAKDGTPGGVIVGRFNQFDLKPGQWTDDASMGLCLADALLANEGRYDGATVRVWFHNWWFNGLNNAFRLDHSRRNIHGGDSLSVGLGGNIAQSLREIEICAQRRQQVPPRFRASNSDAGNGSLMRLAAVPILHHADLSKARSVAYESSLTTHPGPMAAEACAFLAHAICCAIHWVPPPVDGMETTGGASGAGTENLPPSSAPNPKAFLDEVVKSYLEEVLSKPTASSAQEIDTSSLSVKEMKRLLAKHGVDSSGCIEKSDLRELVLRTCSDGDAQAATSAGDDEGKVAMRRLLSSAEPTDGKEAVWNWRHPEPGIEATLAARGRSYNGYPVSAGYFGAFSIDGLAVALHCIYHTESFNAAIVKCINFCGDADTTGSICAQLAGAMYGFAAIDSQWVEDMRQWAGHDIELRAALLYLLGDDDA